MIYVQLLFLLALPLLALAGYALFVLRVLNPRLQCIDRLSVKRVEPPQKVKPMISVELILRLIKMVERVNSSLGLQGAMRSDPRNN